MDGCFKGKVSFLLEKNGPPSVCLSMIEATIYLISGIVELLSDESMLLSRLKEARIFFLRTFLLRSTLKQNTNEMYVPNYDIFPYSLFNFFGYKNIRKCFSNILFFGIFERKE